MALNTYPYMERPPMNYIDPHRYYRPDVILRFPKTKLDKITRSLPRLLS